MPRSRSSKRGRPITQFCWFVAPIALGVVLSVCARSGPVSATDNSKAQGGPAVIDRTTIVSPLPTPQLSRRDVLVGSRWLLRSVAFRKIVPLRIIFGPPCALLPDCELRTTFEKLPSGKIRVSTQVRRPNGDIAQSFHSDLPADQETRWLFKEDGHVDGQGLFRPGVLLIRERGKWALSEDEERLILDPNRPSEMIFRIESFGPQSFKLGTFTITDMIEIEFVPDPVAVAHGSGL